LGIQSPRNATEQAWGGEYGVSQKSTVVVDRAQRGSLIGWVTETRKRALELYRFGQTRLLTHLHSSGIASTTCPQFAAYTPTQALSTPRIKLLEDSPDTI
jgi:hypothetical protein